MHFVIASFPGELLLFKETRFHADDDCMPFHVSGFVTPTVPVLWMDAGVHEPTPGLSAALSCGVLQVLSPMIIPCVLFLFFLLLVF